MDAEALAIALLIVGVLHFGSAATFFVRQRKQFPVVGRDFRLSMLFLLSIVGIQLSEFLGIFLADDECNTANVVLYCFGIVCVNILVSHCCRVWLLFYSAEQRLAGLNKDQDEKLAGIDMESDVVVVESDDEDSQIMAGSDDEGWYARNINKFHSRTFAIVPLVVSLVEMVTITGVSLATSSHEEGMSNCPDTTSIWAMTSVFAGIAGLGLVYVVWKLRRVDDEYGLKKELKYSSLVILPFAIAQVIVELFVTSPETFSYNIVTRVLCHHVIVAIWFDYPIYKSFHQGVTPKNSTLSNVSLPECQLRCSNSITLEQVLHDPNFEAEFESFTKHVVTGLSVEVLLLYSKLRIFRKLIETQSQGDVSEKQGNNGGASTIMERMKYKKANRKMAFFAARIYSEFMAQNNSPMRANIPDRIFQAVRTELRESVSNFDRIVDAHIKKRRWIPNVKLARDFDVHSLDDLSDNVKGLLEHDVFRRWKEKTRKSQRNQNAAAAAVTASVV